jgi:DNA (cytosine-5)-methyltransferase 1
VSEDGVAYTVDGLGVQAFAFAQNQRGEVRLQGDGDISGALAAEPGMQQQTYVTHTLTSKGAEASEDGTGRGVPMVVRMREGKPGGGKGPLISEGLSLTLAGGNDQTLFAPVAFTERTGGGGRTQERQPCDGMAVRRLTPLECERLQGFPDGHTAHDAAGKAISDSARYRMLGNAVAVPVAQWIAERIVEATEKEATDA